MAVRFRALQIPGGAWGRTCQGIPDGARRVRNSRPSRAPGGAGTSARGVHLWRAMMWSLVPPRTERAGNHDVGPAGGKVAAFFTAATSPPRRSARASRTPRSGRRCPRTARWRCRPPAALLSSRPDLTARARDDWIRSAAALAEVVSRSRRIGMGVGEEVVPRRTRRWRRTAQVSGWEAISNHSWDRTPGAPPTDTTPSMAGRVR